MAGFNLFPVIAVDLKPACQKAIDKTALAIAADAQDAAPVRTGFMSENVYAVLTDGTSSYGMGSVSPPGDSYLLPEVKPDNDLMSIVGAAANYSVYVEMGTRFMGAQPFFTPAVVTGQGVLDAELALVFTLI